jgi:bacillopeptidase F (M6 metalloprotease family)
MNRKKKAFIAIATTAVLLDASSAARAAMQEGERSEYGGSVVPCSLSGVNPAVHPEIFANPGVAAREYGFALSRDGVWHVQCSGVGAPVAANNYASTTQKAPVHHRKTALKPSGRAVKGE